MFARIRILLRWRFPYVYRITANGDASVFYIARRRRYWPFWFHLKSYHGCLSFDMDETIQTYSTLEEAMRVLHEVREKDKATWRQRGSIVVVKRF